MAVFRPVRMGVEEVGGPVVAGAGPAPAPACRERPSAEARGHGLSA
ncbi:hypothetical protein SAMN06265360_101312 [Haloechinothrix alba]|uniref:Uncharacterized protein n=1 Tax=Haloechinothrix alba TaxID=664784 RepID=A0A238V3S5_9PSEU|nr:hypothetical protein SAMN06265360_101312 [Haloechinothrix alba]